MSHVVKIETQVRDREAIAMACDKLGLPPAVEGTARLFNTTLQGLLLQLPEWRYPVVIDTTGGQLQYDNYGGHWGAPQQLHRFLQRYAVEKARLEARRQGYTASEQLRADGSIQVTIAVGA